MARPAKGGLSRHPQHGFRITVGKKPDGKPKLFWLGQERRVAERRAGVLKDQFTRMRTQGRDIWTVEDVSLVDRVVAYLARQEQRAFQEIDEAMAGLEETRHELEQERTEAEAEFGPTPVTPTATPEVTEARPMLHAMIDRFVKKIEGDREKSDSTKVRLRECLEAAKYYHPDIDVAGIDRLWVDEMCQFWRNLPKNRKTGKPIRTRTAKTVLGYLLQFFRWMSDNEAATNFREPKRMEKLFRIKISDIGQIHQVTLDEVKQLYLNATDQQRLYLLCGFMCGMIQSDLTATTVSEFDFESAIWSHDRHKTGVPCRHWMCPELVTLLKKRIAKTPANEKNLAFLTAEGRELVTYGGGRKVSDSIKQSWDDLLHKAKLKSRRTFKWGRKFLGQWVRDHYGKGLAQVAIMQKQDAVIDKHYAPQREFKQLHKAQRALYKAMQKAGVFEVEVT